MLKIDSQTPANFLQLPLSCIFNKLAEYRKTLADMENFRCFNFPKKVNMSPVTLNEKRGRWIEEDNKLQELLIYWKVNLIARLCWLSETISQWQYIKYPASDKNNLKNVSESNIRGWQVQCKGWQPPAEQALPWLKGSATFMHCTALQINVFFCKVHQIKYCEGISYLYALHCKIFIHCTAQNQIKVKWAIPHCTSIHRNTPQFTSIHFKTL